jgi:hypothetical protein
MEITSKGDQEGSVSLLVVYPSHSSAGGKNDECGLETTHSGIDMYWLILSPKLSRPRGERKAPFRIDQREAGSDSGGGSGRLAPVRC